MSINPFRYVQNVIADIPTVGLEKKPNIFAESVGLSLRILYIEH